MSASCSSKTKANGQSDSVALRLYFSMSLTYLAISSFFRPVICALLFQSSFLKSSVLKLAYFDIVSSADGGLFVDIVTRPTS